MLRERVQRYVSRPASKLSSPLFALLVLVVIAIGWQMQGEGHLTPEKGVGYWLGIVGSVMMLLLLLYPLRKRIRLFRAMGSVSAWFRAHMILGVVGPLLILFHTNYSLASLNSSIAFITMTLVALSGLVGRYLYAQIHMGLYGRTAKMSEILADARALIRQVVAVDGGTAAFERELTRFEVAVLRPEPSLTRSFLLFVSLGATTRQSRRVLMHEVRGAIRSQGKRCGWKRRERKARLEAARLHLTAYLAAVRKAALFRFCERLFALWHVLHLPLFFFLILTTVVHIIAVHLY